MKFLENPIIPAIIAKNQKELNKRISKVKNYASRIQLDVMDKKFVKNSSLEFDFKLPKIKGKYEAHLMVKNPEKWLNKNYKKVNTIIFHLEAENNPKKIIKLIKSKRKNVGIALKPKTSINKIKPFLSKIDVVLIMTVHPGKYGAKFIPLTLKKIRELRKLKPKLNIEVDGGISNKTISKTFLAGANMFVSGSYLQKSKDIKSSIIHLNYHLLKTKGGKL